MEVESSSPVTCRDCFYNVADCHKYVGACVSGSKKKSLTCETKEYIRSYNIGSSDYSKHKIQPWDIWLEYDLNPWDADIIKRILRTKEGEDRILDYEKIIHIVKERIRQLKL